MDNLNKYVDICLIDEYAEGYSLDIDDLSEHERSNFLNQLMKHDDSVRDFVLNTMQKIINERLFERELDDRNNSGLRLVHLSNGDVQIVKENSNLFI